MYLFVYDMLVNVNVIYYVHVYDMLVNVNVIYYVHVYDMLVNVNVIYYVHVYDMLVNVNVIYYVHVCEQAHWARSAGNSAIENVCIIIIYYNKINTKNLPINQDKIQNTHTHKRRSHQVTFCTV